MFRRLVTVVLSLLVIGAHAEAAAIVAIEGAVTVNSGDGFKPARVGHELRQGDRVMVPRDGLATIEYDDECIFEIDTHHVLTIYDRSPCDSSGKSLTLDETPAIVSDHTASLLGDGVIGLGMSGAPVGIWLWRKDDDPNRAVRRRKKRRAVSGGGGVPVSP